MDTAAAVVVESGGLTWAFWFLVAVALTGFGYLVWHVRKSNDNK